MLEAFVDQFKTFYFNQRKSFSASIPLSALLDNKKEKKVSISENNFSEEQFNLLEKQFATMEAQ